MKKTIAVIFDFDDTLAPDSTSGLLSKLGVNVNRFWNEELQTLLNSDWDPVPAYLGLMIKYSQSRTVSPMTKKLFEDWGKRLPFHPGVKNIFKLLRGAVKKVNPNVDLEFYLVSSGIEDVLRATPVAKEFRDIWGSQFSYGKSGAIDGIKRVISFTDKTRYIFQISKGFVGASVRGKPFEVNRQIENLRIPMKNMVFVGDGYTDIPCFSLIRKGGGIVIGVYDVAHKEKWRRAWGFIEDGRVSSLVPANYKRQSALSNLLVMAVESIAQRITLEASISE